MPCYQYVVPTGQNIQITYPSPLLMATGKIYIRRKNAILNSNQYFVPANLLYQSAHLITITVPFLFSFDLPGTENSAYQPNMLLSVSNRFTVPFHRSNGLLE